jgi:cytochrome b pre-mRNA-processing protein 3
MDAAPQPPDTYHAWFQLAMQHIWAVLFRLRDEGSEGQALADELIGHFWADVERRMLQTGAMSNPMILGRNLKIFSRMYYGTAVSYDYAFCEDNDVLIATALWKNAMGMREPVTATELSDQVRDIRTMVAELFALDSEILFDGRLSAEPVEPSDTTNESAASEKEEKERQGEEEEKK